MPVRQPSRPPILLALAAMLAIAGCSKPSDVANDTAAAAAPLPMLPATLPMATGAATTAAYAPPVAALPAARPVRTVRLAHPGDAYAYADDAYGFTHALGNAPPDYGFDYQGTEPWAWQGYDQSRTFVEPVEGGYRYYYYRPGSETPYFVRDPDYGYGYDNGSLAVIYGAGGAILPYADYGPRLGYASRYLLRAEALYEASRGNERRAVNAANWAARQDAIAASRDRWAAAEAQQAGWQAYRARVADQQAQHWAQEAARRDADAQRFAAWHDDGFRSAPPPRAIPVAWQQAPWAQDQQRYRPAREASPPVTAFQRPAEMARPVVAAPSVAPGQAFPQRFGGERRPDGMTGPRAATAPPAPQQQMVRAEAIQQQQAHPAQQNLAHQQQVASRGQEMQAVAQRQRAQQADRQQHAVTVHAPPARPVAPPPAPVVQVHRGSGSGDPGMALHEAQRQVARDQQQAVRQQADRHQVDRVQLQAAHQAQQAVHQQEAAAHQQPTHAAPVPHAAPPPQPHAAPVPHPAPHPQGGEPHGEHHG